MLKLRAGAGGNRTQASCLINRFWLEDVPGGQPVILGDRVLGGKRDPLPSPHPFSLSASKAPFPFPDHPRGSSAKKDKKEKQFCLEFMFKEYDSAKWSGEGAALGAGRLGLRML